MICKILGWHRITGPSPKNNKTGRIGIKMTTGRSSSIDITATVRTLCVYGLCQVNRGTSCTAVSYPSDLGLSISKEDNGNVMDKSSHKTHKVLDTLQVSKPVGAAFFRERDFEGRLIWISWPYRQWLRDIMSSQKNADEDKMR